MAITDNKFTQEEFETAVAADPTLLAAIRPALATRKFILHDEAEHANYLKTIVEPKIVGDANKKFHDNLEKDVKELFGEDKTAVDEKSYAYLKRVAGAKMGTLKQIETELAELKKGGAPDAADKARIKQLEEGLKAKQTEFDVKIKEKDTTINTMKTTGLIDKQLSPLRAKYKDNLPKALVENYENAIINELIAQVRYTDEGKVVLYDGDKLLTDANLLPLTIEAVLATKLADIIDTGKKGSGTGTGKDDVKDDAKKTEFTSLPADVKTKVALSEYLLKLGYLDGSPEMDKILAEQGKSLPLR